MTTTTHAAAHDIRSTLVDAEAERNPAAQAEHQLCEAWAYWVQTRKFFGPPPALTSNTLAKLQRTRRAVQPSTGPDAACSPQLMALNIAITAKPLDGGRTVFELFYRHRVRNVKAAAAELHISRATWYRRLEAFRRQVISEAGRIEAQQLAQAATLGQHQAQADEVDA